MCAEKTKLRLDQKVAKIPQSSSALSVEEVREVFDVPAVQPTYGGARGKRGKNKKLVFEAAFSGTSEDYRKIVFPLLVSLEAIPRV
jgi:hypothetical protein